MHPLIKYLLTILLFFGMAIYLQLSWKTTNISIKSNIPAVDIIDKPENTSPNEMQLKPMIFTIVNYGYLDFVKNLCLTLERVNITDYIVCCTDKKCYEEIMKFVGESHVELIKLRVRVNTHVLGYGGVPFKRFVFQRPFILREMYKKYYHQYIEDPYSQSSFNAVLYLDSDMAAIQNFIPLLQQKYWRVESNDIRNGEIYDFVVVDDGPHLCTCFMFVPFNSDNHKRVLKFINEWNDRCVVESKKVRTAQPNYRIHSDQDVFDEVVHNGVYNDSQYFKLGLVDENLFPNGHRMRNPEFKQFIDNNSVQLIHSNFMRGVQRKREFLKTNGAWLL